MQIVNRQTTRLSSLAAMITGVLALVLVPIAPAFALSGGDFNAGNIISNAVFTNSGAMSTNDIQLFLNSKVPNCDTNGAQSKSYYYNSGSGRINNNADSWVTTTRAVYGQRYNTANNTTRATAPFVCLKDYVENPSNQQSNLNNPSASIPGGQSAAQIIYTAGQTHGINPQVLLVTLQKEQGVVTDDWPWTNQFQIAMGYACPDTAPCDSQYYGFANQVNNAAKQFRRYLNNPTNYNYVTGNNFIRYNPNSSCGGSNVNVQNQATASLYNYTPYQPNASALANVSDSSAGGSGDGCGAYGNRNFWWYFNKWFGSTQSSTPYAWTVAGSVAYADSGRMQPFSNSPVIDIAPGGMAYVTLQARNNGYQTWTKSIVHLGTSYPNDRSSPFSNGTWLSPQRIEMVEASVAPGDIGTFRFSLTAPQQTGTYVEHFSLVADGITWLNDPNLFYTVNVASAIAPTNSVRTGLGSGQVLRPGERLMSADSQTVFTMGTDGNVQMYVDFKPVWSNNVRNNNVDALVLQGDGNLVEYDKTGHPLWATGTTGSNNYLAIQADGNAVMYGNGGAAQWASNTGTIPSNHLAKANYSIVPNGVLFPGQFMQTADRAYTLVLQASDGNLVEYDSNGRAIWSSGTSGANNALVMQADGNLVIYGDNGRALWTTNTGGGGNTFTMQASGILSITNGNNAIAWSNRSILQPGQFMQTADRAYTLVLQASDGNLVEYDSNGRAIWSSGTRGGNNLVLQNDGNLVIYNRSGQAIWASNTGGRNNVFALQSDGNMVIYGTNGRALWAH